MTRAKAEARAAQLEDERKKIEANRQNTLFYHEHLNQYIKTMRDALDARESYFETPELREIHERAKRNAVSKVPSQIRMNMNQNNLFDILGIFLHLV